MKRVIVLYVPVLHSGYLKLFRKYKGKVSGLYLLGPEFIHGLMPSYKEIRALEPTIIKKFIETLGLFPSVKVLSRSSLKELKEYSIISADEEISRKFAEAYFPGKKVSFEKVFLRWDAKNVQSSVGIRCDCVSKTRFDRERCAEATHESEKSSDWWRHVGAVVVRGKKVIFRSHNHHVPSEHVPYAQGDPRDAIKAGTLNLVYTSLHAEQSIIAEAAREGASLAGTAMYLNVFPCPLCAKLMAYAGIKKCFYRTGSAWLDAESILRANGVKIILVK